MSSHQGKKIAKSLKIGRDIAIFVCLMKIQKIFEIVFFNLKSLLIFFGNIPNFIIEKDFEIKIGYYRDEEFFSQFL